MEYRYDIYRMVHIVRQISLKEKMHFLIQCSDIGNTVGAHLFQRIFLQDLSIRILKSSLVM